MTKTIFREYFNARADLLISLETKIEVKLCRNGMIEVSNLFREREGACFKIVLEYKRVSSFMKAFGLKRMEDIYQIDLERFTEAHKKKS